MASRNGAMVPVLALILGILAILFSFLAYAKRIKVSEKLDGSCVYPGSPASALGVIAALCSLAAQIIITVGTNCFCCCGVRCVSRCTTITSRILFILSWITFVIAFMGLIFTSTLNNSRYLARKYPENKYEACPIGNENLFLGAAVWCIITLILSLISYAFSVCASEPDIRNIHLQGTGNYDLGVAMGQRHMSHMQQPKEQC